MMLEVSWDPKRRRSWASLYSILSGYETVVNIVYVGQCALYTPQCYSVFLFYLNQSPFSVKKNNYEISLNVLSHKKRDCSTVLSIDRSPLRRGFHQNLFLWSRPWEVLKYSVSSAVVVQVQQNSILLTRGFYELFFFQSSSNTKDVIFLSLWAEGSKNLGTRCQYLGSSLL
jgi:hypothetical protein